jgi:hypothetical protein
MKQEYNISNKEEKNALETAVTSSFRAISPSYENAHSWYVSQKPIIRHASIRSRFYMPVFSSAFAAVCAFIMILSLNSEDKIAQIDQNNANTPEVAMFAINNTLQDSGEIGVSSARSMKMAPVKIKESPILSKIDKSISTSSRSKEEVFVTLDSSDNLTSLFE